MRKKKVYGWVIENMEDRVYLKNSHSADSLKTATVYLTRAKARQRYRLSDDIIRRVSLDCEGRAVAIVPGR